MSDTYDSLEAMRLAGVKPNPSPQIRMLENFGIHISLSDEYRKYVKSLGFWQRLVRPRWMYKKHWYKKAEKQMVVFNAVIDSGEVARPTKKLLEITRERWKDGKR